MTDLLGELALLHGTDKATEHDYTPHYHERMERYRYDDIAILEIGVGGYGEPNEGGESLKMWRDYFPNATIVGLDNEAKTLNLGERIIIEQGDQSDGRVHKHLGETYGPFHLIVDDGSHEVDDILRSWVGLWKYVADGGWYVIEDLQTAYWPPFGGSSVRTGETTIGFLQGLIDRIHYLEIDLANYNVTDFERTLEGLDIRRNIAFIKKGSNVAPSNRMPPHPHARLWP